MTSKLVVNTIEADTGISSVSFASSISMDSTSKFHFSAAGVDIGADTNINRPASGVLGFNINSSEKARIDSGGRLLLNTTTEGHGNADDLTIATAAGSLGNTGITIRSSTTGDGNIFFSDATSGDGETKGVIKYAHNGDSLRFNTAGSERLRIASNGAVGINRTSPNHTLEVGGNVYLTSNTSNANEGGGLLFQSKTGGFNSTSCAAIKGLRTSDTSSYLTFETGGTTERLRITSNGKINIGDTDQTQNVDQFSVTLAAQNAVDNVARFQSTAAASGTSESLVKIYKGAGYGGVISGYITQGSDHGLKFYTANDGSLSERLRIDSNGNMGLGTQLASDAGSAGAGLKIEKYVHRNNIYAFPDGYYAASLGEVNNTQTKVWASVDSHYASSSAVSAGLFLSAFHQDTGGSGCGSAIKNLKTGNALTFSTVTTGASVGSVAVETERLRIDSSGRLLIGTTTEGQDDGDNLTIDGSGEGTGRTGMTIRSATNTFGSIFFSDATSGAGEYDGVVAYDHSTQTMRFSTASTQRMFINSDGHVTKPANPSFRAGLNSNTTFNQNTNIVFNDTGSTWHYNRGNHYNTSNGRFTAPVTGVYQFNACVIWYGVSNNTFMGDAFHFYVNGGNACYSGRRAYYNTGTTGNSLYYTDHMSVNLLLNATDYVNVRQSAPVVTVHGNTYYTWFAGSLLG